MKPKRLREYENENISDVLLLEGIDQSGLFTRGKETKIEHRLANYIIFTARLQDLNIAGANGVAYPKSIMKPAFEASDMRAMIENKQFLGELDHPDIDLESHSKRYVMTRLGLTLYERASHVITDIWFKGNTIYGRIETLMRNEHGEKLTGLIEQHIPVAFSFRALGKKGMHHGQLSLTQLYRIAGYDAVTRPSFKQSWLQNVEESVMFEHDSIDITCNENIDELYSKASYCDINMEHDGSNFSKSDLINSITW